LLIDNGNFKVIIIIIIIIIHSKEIDKKKYKNTWKKSMRKKINQY